MLAQRQPSGEHTSLRGVELLEFVAGADELTCTLRDQSGRVEQLRTRYLIGCNGAHSTVRRAGGIPFKGGAYPQTFVLADLEVDGELEPNAGHAFLGAEGMLFFFPPRQSCDLANAELAATDRC